MSYFDNTKHIKKFGGDIWYVNDAMATSGVGTGPATAFKTIGEAITAASAGDAINVMAGTYTEVGLNISTASVRLWFEIGAIIDPASGTGLVVSGNYCKILGQLLITPSAAIGLSITGSGGYFELVKVSGGTVGYSISGAGNEFLNCRCVGQSTHGFLIAAGQQKLKECSTIGADGATYGFLINNSADKGILCKCTSVSHGTSGFYIETGSKDWTMLDCSSGHGDGKWRDIDNHNVWSNFLYEDPLYHLSTLTATGGVGAAGTNYNLFKVTGAITIHKLIGHVTTECAATASAINIELYSAGGTVDITDSLGGPDLNAAVVGTTFVRNSISTDPLGHGDPSASPAIIEDGNYRTSDTPLPLIADVGNDTYIQLVLATALASGAIHWHCHWEPVTDDGFLETV